MRKLILILAAFLIVSNSQSNTQTSLPINKFLNFRMTDGSAREIALLKYFKTSNKVLAKTRDGKKINIPIHYFDAESKELLIDFISAYEFINNSLLNISIHKKFIDSEKISASYIDRQIKRYNYVIRVYNKSDFIQRLSLKYEIHYKQEYNTVYNEIQEVKYNYLIKSNNIFVSLNPRESKEIDTSSIELIFDRPDNIGEQIGDYIYYSIADKTNSELYGIKLSAIISNSYVVNLTKEYFLPKNFNN